MLKIKRIFFTLALATAATMFVAASPAKAATTKQELDREATQHLAKLIKANPNAALVAKKAKAVLIFPNIIKAGLVFGGAYGEGVLRQNKKADAYYNSITASWGLQAGAQSYGYIVFLMTNKAVNYIHDSNGWEIGVGPTVAIIDEGAGKNLSTSTLKDDAYAFIFDQQGLMASLSLEGTKISRIKTP
jgi:lipid-binding SYLF domain-containing protein